MMKKSIVLLALLMSACSGHSDSAALQQRITELEEQNAKLQRDLQKAQDNVAALQRIMNSNAGNAAQETPADGEGAPGQPVAPQPSNNLGGGGMPPAC